MSHFGGRVVSGEEDEDDETPVSVSEIANSDNSLGLNDRVTPEVLDFKSQEAAALSSSTPLAVPPAAPPATTSVVISTPRIAVTPLLAQLQSANVEMQLQLSTFCASQLAASSIKVHKSMQSFNSTLVRTQETITNLRTGNSDLERCIASMRNIADFGQRF